MHVFLSWKSSSTRRKVGRRSTRKQTFSARGISNDTLQRENNNYSNYIQDDTRKNVTLQQLQQLRENIIAKRRKDALCCILLLIIAKKR